MTEGWKNKLYFGDNLDILRADIPSESVDLIYLDPPFNSNANYNVLFQEKSGEKSAAQITAFEDTWHWGYESEYAYQDVVKGGPEKLSKLVQALRGFLGQNDMMAYLVMMAQRMVELHRVLKPTGSIYLHCDPTASHYLKLLMDAVFSQANYRNEVVWRRTSAHSDVVQGARQMGRIHDIIFFYSKSSHPNWNPVFTDYSEEYVLKAYRYVSEDGRRYQTQPLHARKPGGDTRYEWKGQLPPPNRYWAFSRENMERLEREGRIVYSRTGVPRYKVYLDESRGKSLQDLWDDIPPVHTSPKERLGYPTQKPEALLERVIAASSSPDDLVLDPFCGCGTTVSVAERLQRRWIGIDITHLAIALMKRRLEDTFGNDLRPYEVIGQPRDEGSARALAEQNRHQFEWWAVDLVDAHPAQDKRKGADRGVDGYIRFFDDETGQAKSIVVQVKSGHVNASVVRDLKGVREREEAAIGLLVTLEEPTEPMKQEAISAGFYTPKLYPDQQYPRIQVMTIQQLLAGEQPKYPRVGIGATFKKASRRRKTEGDQQSFV